MLKYAQIYTDLLSAQKFQLKVSGLIQQRWGCQSLSSSSSIMTIVGTTNNWTEQKCFRSFPFKMYSYISKWDTTTKGRADWIHNANLRNYWEIYANNWVSFLRTTIGHCTNFTKGLHFFAGLRTPVWAGVAAWGLRRNISPVGAVNLGVIPLRTH